MKKTKILSLIVNLVLLLVLSLTFSSATNEVFKDIKNHWAKDTILELANKKIISGYPDGTFKPNNPITVAEFTKLIMESRRVKSDYTGKPWYGEVVNRATQEGIIKEGEFTNYNKHITRGEMARMISRAINEEYPSNVHEYNTLIGDYDKIPSNLQNDVVRTYYKGIIGGYPDGTFKADNKATRAEAGVMITRLQDPSRRIKIREILDYSGITIEGDTYKFENGVLYWKERDSEDKLTGKLIRLDKNAEVIDMKEIVDYFIILRELEVEIDGYLHIMAVPYQGGIRGFGMTVSLSKENSTDFYNAAGIEIGMGTLKSEHVGKMAGISLRNITQSPYAYRKVEPNPYLETAERLVKRFTGKHYQESIYKSFEENIKKKAYNVDFFTNDDKIDTSNKIFNLRYSNSSGYNTSIRIEYKK